MEAIKKSINRLLEWTCVVLLGMMTILVTYQVITRYLFDSPNAYTEVLSRYMFVWLIMYGSAYVFGLREHMNITFFRDHLPEKVRLIVEIVGELIIVIFISGVMIYGGYNQMIDQMGQLDAALQIPMGIIYSSVPISSCFIVFYFIYNEMELIKQLRSSMKGEVD